MINKDGGKLKEVVKEDVVREFHRTEVWSDPSLSPDGKKKVWVETNYNDNIFVSNIDGSEKVQLTKKSSRDWTRNNPVWSSDGKQIMYYSCLYRPFFLKLNYELSI